MVEKQFYLSLWFNYVIHQTEMTTTTTEKLVSVNRLHAERCCWVLCFYHFLSCKLAIVRSILTSENKCSFGVFVPDQKKKKKVGTNFFAGHYVTESAYHTHFHFCGTPVHMNLGNATVPNCQIYKFYIPIVNWQWQSIECVRNYYIVLTEMRK